MERRGIQVYLMPVKELLSCGEKAGAEQLPGFSKLTAWQQARVGQCRERAMAALRLGAELLLQFAAHRAAENRQLPENSVNWQLLTAEQLLFGIPQPLPLEIIYGERGKPAVANVSWHYNLSHSGEYAALALSSAPVGIDIQKKGTYNQAMVRRFFSPEETKVYEKLVCCARSQAEETTELFYTLWCRKEAYGKLRGTGLTEDVLKYNVLEDAGVIFREWNQLPGYQACVCCEKG